MKIYEEFKNPNNENSIAIKNAISDGWLSRVHSDWLLELKDRFFKDIHEVANTMTGDHLEFFALTLEPNDDDLEGTIKGYENVKLVGEKFDKVNRDFLKIIDNLKRRKRGYDLFEKKSKL